MNDTLVRQFRWQFEEARSGSRWHSLRAVLADLTPAEADWTPPAYAGFAWNRGSIREIVVHLGGDHLHQISRAFGQGEWTWEAVLARYRERGGDLAAALALLDEGFAAIFAALATLTDDDLTATRRNVDGRRFRPRELFQMLLEHTLYHAGQIQYARCIYQGLQSATESPERG